jgi:hypothetical protein
VGHDTPERRHLDPDDQEDERAWQQLSAELMGKDASLEGIAAAHRETSAADTELRRSEFRTRIFEAGDLLTRAPADFPDRTTLLSLLTASEQLTNEMLARDRAHQLRVVLNELRSISAVLENEASTGQPEAPDTKG